MPELTVKFDGRGWNVVDEEGTEIMSYDKQAFGEFAEQMANDWKDAYLRGYEEANAKTGWNAE